MSSPDADASIGLVRSLYAALASSDRAALDALLSTDFVGDVTRGLPLGLGRRYDGPADMRRNLWGAVARAFDVVVEPADFQELADGRVVVTGTYVGSARSTGTKFEADFVHTISIRDGQIVALKQVTDSAAWAAALGEPMTTVRFHVSDGSPTSCSTARIRQTPSTSPWPATCARPPPAAHVTVDSGRTHRRRGRLLLRRRRHRPVRRT